MLFRSRQSTSGDAGIPSVPDSPASLGIPFPLWGKAWFSLEIAGVGYRKDAVLDLLGGSLPTEGVRKEFDAVLRPEPTNSHDANAIAVDIDSRHVGYLPAEEALRYREALDRMAAVGQVPMVRAQVWAQVWQEWDIDAGGRESTSERLSCSVRLALDEPHLILPSNRPPAAPHHLLPQGHSVKVGSTAEALPTLVPYCPAEGQAWVYVTLHSLVEQLARSEREVVEVRIDDAPIGRLTPKMSEQFLPAIAMLARGGQLAAGRALVKGNSLKVDVALHAERVQNLSAEWVAAREREAQATAPDVAPPVPEFVAPSESAPPVYAEPTWPVLVKGQNTDLPAADVHVALSWSLGPAVDVTGMLTAGGKVRGDDDLVFYNQPVHPSGAVRVGPVTSTGSYLDVALSSVESSVDAIVLTASADGAPFRDVRDLCIEVSTATGPVARYAVTDVQGETAFVMAELYRRGDGWRFRAVGQGYNSGLTGLATDYGVDIDD